MKKLFIVLLLSLSFSSNAQWLEVSATGGAAYYRISAGIKNGFCGIYDVDVAVVKLKILDFGVQLTGTSKLTICSSMSPGVFADIVMREGESDKNIFIAGVHGNLVNYGSVKTPGAYFNDGSIDTVSTKVDKSLSYGVRLGYKRQFSEHIYGYVLANVTYTMASTIHYGTTATNNCAVLTEALMVGIAARF